MHILVISCIATIFLNIITHNLFPYVDAHNTLKSYQHEKLGHVFCHIPVCANRWNRSICCKSTLLHPATSESHPRQPPSTRKYAVDTSCRHTSSPLHEDHQLLQQVEWPRAVTSPPGPCITHIHPDCSTQHLQRTTQYHTHWTTSTSNQRTERQKNSDNGQGKRNRPIPTLTWCALQCPLHQQLQLPAAQQSTKEQGQDRQETRNPDSQRHTRGPGQRRIKHLAVYRGSEPHQKYQRPFERQRDTTMTNM